MAKSSTKSKVPADWTPLTFDAAGAINADDIAERAYHRFLARGGEHGHDVEDWMTAEQELRTEARGLLP